MASICCTRLGLSCLPACLLVSIVGALVLDADDGGFQKKSFAAFDSPALHPLDRRSASRAQSRGQAKRISRQAPRADEGVMSYTPDETQAMLNSHIEYRRNVTPPAADMNTITWNTELANLARGWAERCEFEHGFPSEPQVYGGLVAQNLWMGTKSYGLTAAVTAWYNEYKDYDYATATCSAECGHYRAVVYSGLESIGCGSAICNSGRDMLTVCNYGPSVPRKGVPYKAGPPCALCASGTGWCDNKLCRSDCEEEGTQCKCNLQCQNCGQLDNALCKCNCKAGWRGTDCSEPCTNYKDYCDSGAYTPEACVGDTGAQKDCPATCELCASLGEATPSEEKCCDGKTCDTGQVLDESSCECLDYLEKTGAGGPGSGAAPFAVSWTSVALFPALVASLRMLIG